MKIEVLKDNFKRAINICEKITRKNVTLPILQNVLIKTEKNFLRLITTNLETSISYWILAKIEEAGSVAVPATFLANLVNLINTDKIELLEENGNLILTSPDQKVQIQGQNPEEFPIIPQITQENTLQVSIDKLAGGLSQVIDIPSTSQIRPEISGVYFAIKKGKLRLVATDSFRLAEKTIGLETNNSIDGSFIIPQTAGRELINILNQEEKDIDVRFNSNQVLFEIPESETSHSKINLLSRLVEGNYPNYQEIIPKKFTTKVQLEREGFLNQIKKAGLFSGKTSEVRLSIISNEKKLKIFSQSSEAGKNEAFLPCGIEGKNMELAFNYKFLVDGLNSIKSSEVNFEFGSEDGPGALRPVGDESYLYILMPIKAS